MTPIEPRARPPPGPFACSRTVVVDELDVVPIRVEHECTVVARVVDRALSRRPVVPVAGFDEGAMELVHCGVPVDREGDVNVLRRGAVDDRERALCADELRAVRRLVLQPKAGMRRDPS
jgi:hypothetical protein